MLVEVGTHAIAMSDFQDQTFFREQDGKVKSALFKEKIAVEYYAVVMD